MLKTIVLSLLVLALALVPIAHSAWTDNVQVSPANSTTEPNQSFTIMISVTCSTSCGSMHDVYVTWGDGSGSGNLVDSCGSCQSVFYASHVYAVGTYTGQVRVDDTLGNSGLGAFTVTVQDPSPTGGMGGGSKARPV